MKDEWSFTLRCLEEGEKSMSIPLTESQTRVILTHMVSIDEYEHDMILMANS